MNVENEEEYFDAIPNSPPIYTDMTSVVMPKPKYLYPSTRIYFSTAYITYVFYISI